MKKIRSIYVVFLFAALIMVTGLSTVGPPGTAYADDVVVGLPSADGTDKFEVTDNSATPVSLMAVFSNGNVGIGTSSPRGKMEVDLGTKLTGTVNITIASTAVSGTGTNFTSALSVGDYIVVDTDVRMVDTITDDTTLTVDTAFSSTLVGVTITRVGLVIPGGNIITYFDNPTNTFLGNAAGSSNTTGADNSAFGYDALESNTTGTDNTAVGQDALERNTVGYENSAFGADSLQANTSGYYNSAFGRYALEDNTTGVRNTAVGRYALEDNITGTRNTAVGVYALEDSDGSYNTAVGYSALDDVTSGTRNTAVGAYALELNLDSYSTAVGYSALNANVTGTRNTALGTYALEDNLDSYNTAVGYSALNANVTGTRNTALGTYALEDNLGSYNTALGYDAMWDNTTGAYNTVIGANALNQDAVGATTFSRTTVLGYEAGYNSTGSGNVFIGHQAGYGETGSNILRIASNDIDLAVIRNLIYGDFVSGKVGIGTTVPATELDVNGTVTATNFIGNGSGLTGVLTSYTETDPTVPASVKDGTDWTEVTNIPVDIADGDDGILAESDPDVGANTLNYVPKWDGSALVSGSIFDNGNVGIGTSNPVVGGDTGTILEVKANSNRAQISINSPAAEASDLYFLEANTQEWSVSVRGEADNRFSIWDKDGGSWEEDFSILQNGNVGIGTTNPGADLHVVSNSNSVFKVANSNGHGLGINPWGGGSNNVNIDPNTASTNIHLGRNLAVNNWTFESGNVGIGTEAPATKLGVYGPDGGVTAVFGNDAGTNNGLNGSLFIGSDSSSKVASLTSGGTNSHLAFMTNSSGSTIERLRIANTGNVGIGTTSPGSLLHVQSLSSALELQIEEKNAGGSAQFQIKNPARTWWIQADSSPDIFAIEDRTASKSRIAITGSGETIIGHTLTGDGQLMVRQDGTGDIFNLFDAGSNVLTVLDGGNVGIGTTIPGTKLDVNGTVTATNFIGNGSGLTGVLTSYTETDPTVPASVKDGTDWTEVTNIPVDIADGDDGITAEADPQVGANTNYYLPYWNGSALVTSPVFTIGGKVGIGTTSVASRLSVGGPGLASTAVYGTDTNYGLYGVGGNYGVYGTGTIRGIWGAGGSVGVYGTGTTEGVYGSSSGNYGVRGVGGSYGVFGETSKASSTGVRGIGTFSGVWGQGGTYAGYFTTGNVYIQNRLGINTSTPGTGLEIKQEADSYAGGLRLRSSNTLYDWNTYVGGTLGTSNYYFAYGSNWRAYINYVNGTYVASSDRKLKKNIEKMDNVLDKVVQLQPCRYHFKEQSDSDPKSVGFIAQDVEEVFPELVDESDGIKGLAYDNFAVLAIAAIKELKAENDKMRAEIDILKGNVSSGSNTPPSTGENSPPSANNDPAATSEDTPVTINVAGNDTDADGTIVPATVVIVDNPVNGTAVHNGDGTVTYSPYTGHTGTDSFTYTVADGDGATSNKATVTISITGISDPDRYYWLEAEKAESMTSPMQVASDGAASGGQYIRVPNGRGNNMGGTGGYAEYTVNITKEGEYILWGRVIAPSSSDDSFFAKAGSSANNAWSVARGSSWHWDKVNIKGGVDPVKYYLRTGENKIRIGQREDGTKLDKLLLTNDMQFIPAGSGG